MRRLLIAVTMIGVVSEAFAGEFEMPVLRGSSSDLVMAPRAVHRLVARPVQWLRWCV